MLPSQPMKPLKKYHHTWLSKYGFSEEWLREKMAAGFHIHHADGDKTNEKPENLVMIFGKDHLQLHGLSLKEKLRRPDSERKRRIWITPDKKYFVIKRNNRENAMKFHHMYRRALLHGDKDKEKFIEYRCLPIEDLTTYEKAKYL